MTLKSGAYMTVSGFPPGQRPVLPDTILHAGRYLPETEGEFSIADGNTRQNGRRLVFGRYAQIRVGFKYRLQMDNTIGIIDGDYYYSDNEGHIFVKMTNDCNGGKVLELKAGASVCQGIFLPFGITFDDNATARRNGGLGSTSK